MILTKEQLHDALVERHGADIQAKLDKACVGIAGLGGLGSNLAIFLARLGVGHLILVDFAVVDITNLNRQHYTMKDLGIPKTLALVEQLEAINPYLTYETYTERVVPSNVERLFSGCDVVVEAFDKPDQKATSGARNAEEAIRIARLARKMAGTDFVKVEIMRDSKYLLPDNQETIKATEVLANEGFVVMPYMYPDLNVARDLANAGAACIMPLASPIGSNKGLATKDFIQILIDEIDLPIIVDAGIGRPSQACEAMEMGAAAIMANTAIATAGDIPMMASAFKDAIIAGRKAYLAGPGRVLDKGGAASDPLTGFLR